LSNVDLEFQLIESRGKIEEREIELRSMINSGAAGQPGALDRMQEIAGEIRNLKRLTQGIERQFEEMTITSPIDGTVLETPYLHQPNSSEEVKNVDQRSLLFGKHENVSALRGQRFCEVADLSKWYAVVILTENQVKFAKLDQKTKIKLYSKPDQVIEAFVEAIGETDLSIDREDYEAPIPGQPRQSIPQNRPPDLITELISTLQKQDLQYYARVPLPEGEVPLKIGLGGQARLYTGYRSLGARLWWWINQNFRS
jgi:putative peptide zinc metalloprotease protein